MLGIDLVDVGRFRSALERSPGLESRLFTEPERSYCRSTPDPARHFAGTLAAKEAVIKAARLGPLVAWARRIEITRDATGAPTASIEGRNVPIAVSISHEKVMAVAAAIIQTG
ncbi:MAG: holo-ACP synthase [Actinomycetota bacterium]|nr:holo-ACP synthase [Actinomycetota bacterium]